MLVQLFRGFEKDADRINDPRELFHTNGDFFETTPTELLPSGIDPTDLETGNLVLYGTDDRTVVLLTQKECKDITFTVSRLLFHDLNDVMFLLPSDVRQAVVQTLWQLHNTSAAVARDWDYPVEPDEKHAFDEWFRNMVSEE